MHFIQADVHYRVFYETLRLFPPVRVLRSKLLANDVHDSFQVINIPKRSSEDTTLATSDADGNAIVVPVSRGTGIVLDVAGLHYNRKYLFKIVYDVQ